MSTKNKYRNLIFGLKVNHLRKEAELSFSDLSERSGLSLSYLNEIEKGKKYPKQDKLEALASALGTTARQLSSGTLPKKLEPVEMLLKSNFLNELPLDLFGIDLVKIVEIVANAPTRVGAFISTLVELAKHYALQEEHFYFGAMRAYQEMHHNYFEDIEEVAANLREKEELTDWTALSEEMLVDMLARHTGYKTGELDLDKYPELSRFRAIALPGKKKLLLAPGLMSYQRKFQLAKELGYHLLKIKERVYTSSLHRVASFEEVLNNFRAGYFGVALLIPQEPFIKDLEAFFSLDKWDPHFLFKLLEKYEASPEMLFQRFNVLPRFFQIKDVFFLRFIHRVGSENFKLDKELHINRSHQPHSNQVYEHYCRRWLSIGMLQELDELQRNQNYDKPVLGVQRSHYIGSKDEYLCLSFARPSYPGPEFNVSVTIGALIDDKLRKTVRFLDDPAIVQRDVNITCERCPLEDCEERAAPPVHLERRERIRKVDEAVRKLIR